jgi:Flp pilus assembly pilin Flp
MSTFVKVYRRFVRDEEGLETVEYAVMTALIVAALVTAIVALSGAISGRFGKVQTNVSGIN